MRAKEQWVKDETLQPCPLIMFYVVKGTAHPVGVFTHSMELGEGSLNYSHTPTSPPNVV